MAKPDPRCHINHDFNYVFINISKNASTSIKNSIVFNTFTDYKSIKDPDNYFKFIIIRNPIYRVISSYLELIKLRFDGPHNVTSNSKWFKEKDLIESFKLFIEFIDGNFYDSHVLPQVNFLKDKGLVITDIDFVMLHENLSSDFEELIKNDNIKSNGKLVNMQGGDGLIKGKLTDFVKGNIEIQNRINELYHEDIIIYREFKNN